MARNDRRYRRSGRGRNYSGGSGSGKVVGIIIASVIGVLVIGMGIFELCSKGGFYSLFYSIANGKKTADITEKAESVALTQDQMLEDYEYMYHLLADNAPAAYLGKDLYGYSFADDSLYQQGRNEVMKCKSTEEFYAVMRALTLRIPGAASEAVLPLNTMIEKTIDGADSNRKETALTSDLYGFNNVIFQNMVKQGNKYEPDLKLVYVEGEYVTVEKGKVTGTITSIEGEDPVEYIANMFSSERILYDYQKKVAYVPELNLYKFGLTSLGVNVTMEIDYDNGSDDVKKRDYAFDYAADIMIACEELEESKDEKEPARINSTQHHVYTYAVPDRKLGYVRVTAFKDSDFDESHHDYNRVILDVATVYENVIIDLRDCVGESDEYAQELFFKEFFKTDYTVDGAYLLNSGGNTKIRNGNGLGSMLKEKIGGKKLTNLTGEENRYYAVSDKSFTFTGNKGFKKNVIILTSPGTSQSAQTFVAAAKNSGQAYVLGSNTAGEGMSGYFVNACPNSKIVFTYCPYLEVNPDSTVANVKGVAPTDYKSMNLDSLKKLLKQEQEGRDVLTYENRINWDNVLENAVSRLVGDPEDPQNPNNVTEVIERL